MKYRIGSREFEAESRYLTLHLPDSGPSKDDPATLRARMEEDGFLLLRGFHDRGEVQHCRDEILARLGEEGRLDPDAPPGEGVAARGSSSTTSVREGRHLQTDSLRQLLHGPRTLGFFQRLLDGAPLSFNFLWLRAAGPGAASPIHCDIVYMGLGTARIYTLWTPIGRITPEMGALAVCLGSHRWKRVIDTYGRADVDRDRISGVFSEDPAELVDRFGGRWATTTFEPGDVLLLGMHLMHASLVNQSDRFRISCDSRYQRADEPVDERWAGKDPRGHEVLWSPAAELQPVSVSRRGWGV